MTFKSVFTWDRQRLKVRLFRLLWIVGTVGDGSDGYSNKLSVAICPAILGFERGYNEWRLSVLGLQIHRVRSYGGIIV